MMQISAWGRLGSDPKAIETQSGKQMAVCSMAVELAERGNDSPEAEWVGLVAFGTIADRLLKHAKGECISIAGRVQRNRFRDRQGVEQVQLQVVLDSLVSARSVRPGQSRKAAKSTTAGVPFDDALTF